MNPIIEAKKPEIIALCRQYGVSRLDLFGSATGSAWDPDRSDFDFIVEFESYGPGIARRFVGFGDDLERLLGRKVDLVSDRAMRPRFRRSADKTREAVLAS
jgi:predicted nucleotidyltransferase